mgnify:CR=1 FL=1
MDNLCTNGTKSGHFRDSPENGTPHDRDMDRDSGGSSLKGSPPCPVRSCPDSGPIPMRLELRSQGGAWIGVKAVLPAMRGRRKRNFWLGWNNVEQRFARNHDLAAMLRSEQAALETVRQRISAGDFDLVPGR